MTTTDPWAPFVDLYERAAQAAVDALRRFADGMRAIQDRLTGYLDTPRTPGDLTTTPRHIQAVLTLQQGVAASRRDVYARLAEHDWAEWLRWQAEGRLWAAITPGLDEQAVLDRAADVMHRRFLLGWSEQEAAAIAAAMLEGWARRHTMRHMHARGALAQAPFPRTGA